MNMEAQLLLRQEGFTRPIFALGTSLTYLVDLKKSLEQLRANLERNWRNQLNSAEKTAPVFIYGRDRALLERYLLIHNEMCELKGLPRQKLNLGQLQAMADQLGDHVVFFVGTAENQDGCGGALWRFGTKGYFAFSAANAWGRKRYLPNAMYWNAISHLKEAGLETFDVTGIDPKDGWGVYNFKRGLNAQPVEYLGEWDWAASPWTRRVFNLALWAFQDRLS